MMYYVDAILQMMCSEVKAGNFAALEYNVHSSKESYRMP
jgi:hypothetical protein